LHEAHVVLLPMDTEPRRKYRRPQERDYARHDFEGYHAPIGRIAKGF
jgi:hypothetical protein